jgi:hypothetical protein
MTPAAQHNALSMFATTCHAVLEVNMHKGGWDQDDPNSLMTRVREEMIEVEHELMLLGTNQFSLVALERECCDVANMVMMVYDVVRRRQNVRPDEDADSARSPGNR